MQEFPKWVAIEGHRDGGVVVFSVAEERAAQPTADEVAEKPKRPRKPRIDEAGSGSAAPESPDVSGGENE